MGFGRVKKPAHGPVRVSVGRLLWTYSRPYWKSILATLALSIAGSGLAAVMPLILAPVLDLALGRPILPNSLSSTSILAVDLNNIGPVLLDWFQIDASAGKLPTIVALGALFFLASVVANFLTFLAQLLGRSIQGRTARDMQNELLAHILALPLLFFSQQRTGELISRLATDTSATTSGLDKIVRYFISAPLQIAFFGYLLTRTNPSLAVVAVAAALIHYMITRALRGSVRLATVKQYSVFADLSVVIQEAVTGIRLIKSFAAEAFEIGKFRRVTESMVGAAVRQFFVEHVQDPLRSLANQAVGLGIVIFSANELIEGRLEASGFILFIYVGQRLIGAVKVLGDTIAGMQVTAAAAERVVALLSIRPVIKDGRLAQLTFNDRLVVRNLGFAFGDATVLSDVSLEIKRGEMVAFVGPSGAGKTTLVDLILRLHDPQDGQILVDGLDIRSVRQSAYRKLFGVVSQETFLFNTSIRDNILYGRRDISEQELIEAASIANALDFIRELPDGFDTVIGDRGVKLSGGQRQRLAIARAVVGHPPILVMDEATSALDSESERAVQDAIDRVIKGSTAIVIAHRLSTVIHSSRIFVMDRGRILDSGTHTELLDRCELYQRLCQHQFAA